MDPFCYLSFSFVFNILSCMFVATLLTPACKGLPLGTLLCDLFVCHFPMRVLGQLLYLIVSIHDLCLLLFSLLHIKIRANAF